MDGKKYEVTHAVHFIGGRLCKVGEIVTLEGGITPGRWLVEVKGADAVPVGAAQWPVIVPAAGHVGPFKAVHVPIGSYAVHDASGLQVGETFDKAGKGEAKAAVDAVIEGLNAEPINSPDALPDA